MPLSPKKRAGRAATGWKRGIYPVRATAEAALTRGDLFVAEADGRVAAAAVLNQIQVDVYAGAPWEFEAPDEEIFVMHTLVVDPPSEGTDWAARSRHFMSRKPSGRAAGISASTRTCAIPARGGCTIHSGIRRSALRRALSTV